MSSTNRRHDADAPFVVPEDDGRAFWSMGTLMVVKVGAETTGGALSLIELLAAPEYETPYHVHHAEDELFYLLEGEMECHSGEKAFRAGPDDTVFLPRDVPHGFRVVSDDPCRLVAGVMPGGLEAFFAEVGEPADERKLPPPSEPDPEAVATLAADYELEILGPIPD